MQRKNYITENSIGLVVNEDHNSKELKTLWKDIGQWKKLKDNYKEIKTKWNVLPLLWIFCPNKAIIQDQIN